MAESEMMIGWVQQGQGEALNSGTWQEARESSRPLPTHSAWAEGAFGLLSAMLQCHPDTDGSRGYCNSSVQPNRAMGSSVGIHLCGWPDIPIVLDLIPEALARDPVTLSEPACMTLMVS